MILPVICLFILAPFFGEYLLGNATFSQLANLPVMAVLYGGGAVLIREITRRLGRGYGTMIGLGMAYAVIEEGLVDQLFFNTNYFAGQEQLSTTVLPWLGVDAWLTLLLFWMHAIWSICIPIILTEQLFAGRGARPWLGKLGLGVVAAIFVIGSAFLSYGIHQDKQFWASWPQLIGAGAAALIIGGLAITARPWPRIALSPPRPWMVGITGLVASSGYMLTESLVGWARVTACLLIAGAFFLLLYAWTRRGWRAAHTLALASGAILTYAWLGSVMKPESGAGDADYMGRAVIVMVACALPLAAMYRARRGA